MLEIMNKINKVNEIITESKNEYNQRIFGTHDPARNELYSNLQDKCNDIKNAPNASIARQRIVNFLAYIEEIQFSNNDTTTKLGANKKISKFSERNLIADSEMQPFTAVFHEGLVTKSKPARFFMSRKHLDETLIAIHNELSELLPAWVDHYVDKAHDNDQGVQLHSFAEYKQKGITNPDTSSCYSDFKRHLVLNGDSYIDKEDDVITEAIETAFANNPTHKDFILQFPIQSLLLPILNEVNRLLANWDLTVQYSKKSTEFTSNQDKTELDVSLDITALRDEEQGLIYIRNPQTHQLEENTNEKLKSDHLDGKLRPIISVKASISLDAKAPLIPNINADESIRQKNFAKIRNHLKLTTLELNYHCPNLIHRREQAIIHTANESRAKKSF